MTSSGPDENMRFKGVVEK